MPLCCPSLSRRLPTLRNANLLLIAGVFLLPIASAQLQHPSGHPTYPSGIRLPRSHERIHSQPAIPFVTPDASETTPNFGGFYAAPFFNSQNPDAFTTLTGDFNHDGKPDVVTIDAEGQVSVLLNNGAGGFEAPIITNFVSPYENYEAASAAVADLNGDGYDDLIVGNMLDGSQTQAPILTVLLNQKNGTFSQPIFLGGPDRQITTGGRVATYTFGVAKTTSSGHTDLIISEEYETSSTSFETLIQTSLNNGSGSFTLKPIQVIPDTSPNVTGYNLATVFADVNHDGKVDMLLEKDSGGGLGSYEHLFVMPGNGDGTFQLFTSKTTLLFPSPEYDSTTGSVVLARSLTSDASKIDLLLNCEGGTYVALSNGDGTYQSPKLIPTSNQVLQILTADLNGDGKPDLITVGSGILSTYLGNGDGTFSPVKDAVVVVSEVLLGSLQQTVMADFNQDGKIDFVNGNTSGDVELGFGNGDGTFQSTQALLTANPIGVAPGMQAAPDLNGDGVPDTVAEEYGGFLVSGLSNGRGGFTYQTALPSTAYSLGYVEPTVGDFNGDGKQDVVMASYSWDGNNTAAVALSNGNGTLKTPVFVIQPPTHLACELGNSAAGDINGDGKLDLIFTYYGDSNCNSGSTVPPGYLVALGNGDGTFKAPTFVASNGSVPSSIVLAKYHGKNSPLDVVGSFYDTTKFQNALSILQGKGDGTFYAPVLVTDEFWTIYQILGDDFNQDGKPDLTVIGVQNNSTYPIGAFLLTGNGNGTFTDAASLVQPLNGISSGVYAGVYADLNGDGIPDLIDNLSYGLLAVHLGTGHGNFAAPLNFLFDSDYGPIVAGRFLGGNSLSILAPTVFDGGTALFMNQGGSTLTAKASAASIIAGQSLTLSSTLTATLTGQPEPTGTIAFYDGTTEIGTTSVDGSFPSTKLAVGTHSISAKYSGDAHFNPNTSSPITVKVVAEVLAVTLSPASLAFPTTTLGATSPAQIVTVKNTGNTAVTLTALKSGGTDYPDFVAASTTCGASLAAGASCTASIEFKPVATGSATATFDVYDNATGTPQHIALTGTSTPRTVSVSPTSLTFPATKVGSTSAAQVITVKNTCQAAITLLSLKSGGANYPEFLTAATTCGATLAPGASCTASVAFNPSVTGTANATYNVTDNASGTPQKVTLTGTAN